MRRVMLILSLAGMALFGGAFLLAWLHPLLIERGAREIVRIEVEREVGASIDKLAATPLAGLTKWAQRKNAADIAQLEQHIRNEVPRKVANVMANMLDVDCPCRQRMVESAERSAQLRLSSLVQARERLAELVEAAYATVTRDLLREFRIVTASTAVSFALLGLVALVRRTASWQLALPAFVLIGAAALTGGLYLFEQNWLHTIVFGQYVGLGYAVYLSGVTLLLADIVFNRARITTRILNLILEIVGAAAGAVPC